MLGGWGVGVWRARVLPVWVFRHGDRGGPEKRETEGFGGCEVGEGCGGLVRRPGPRWDPSLTVWVWPQRGEVSEPLKAVTVGYLWVCHDEQSAGRL